MEIHHHPNVEKKKFKEYFLEFVMIFLAVTMGFFAENIRESVSAKGKEKIYINGILEDLKNDISDINLVDKTQNRLLGQMDSALMIPIEKISSVEEQNAFYEHFIKFYGWYNIFRQNDNTLAQLRNAGGFSYIHRKKVMDSITRLNNFYTYNLMQNSRDYLAFWNKVIEIAPKIFKIRAYPSRPRNWALSKISPYPEILIRNDKPTLEELYSWIQIEKGQLQLYNSNILSYKAKAIQLIHFLQEEYQLNKQ